jgi:hypothetical protein
MDLEAVPEVGFPFYRKISKTQKLGPFARESVAPR